MELPHRFFKNAEAKEISAMIPWIAQIFGASAKDEIQVILPSAYTRKRSPAQGGQIHLALLETFFATRYGIVVDRFGISWKIMA